MGNESFTETTTESWGARIMNSIKGVLFGIVLFFVAFIVLWWNEGRSVKTAKGLAEGTSQVVVANSNELNKINSGKLIHISGNVTTDEFLKDEEFDIEVNALKLRRNVEMYQWVEESKKEKKKKVGGSEKTKTTYTYNKEWKSKLINSSQFKVTEGHDNPVAFPYDGYIQGVNKSTIGAYTLSNDLLSKIGDFEPYPIEHLDADKVENSSVITDGTSSILKNVYIGFGSKGAPEVGDTKVSFDVVNINNEYSIISKQIGNTFEKFNTSTGTSINMIVNGNVSAENMFTTAQENNITLAWILRFVGFFMMLSGLILVFKPLVIVADVLPFIGSLLNVGLVLFSGIVSIVLSLTTIAMAWIFYRPLLGISLLVIVIIVVAFFYKKVIKEKVSKK